MDNRSDAAFRDPLLEEAVRNIRDGDLETALGQILDAVNAARTEASPLRLQ